MSQADPARESPVDEDALQQALASGILAGEVPGHLVNPEIAARKEAAS